VNANGISIYYERRGSGLPLLFFNGSGATLETSGVLIWSFADQFDVAAHDQRGLGRTSVPPAPYTMADYAADAAALLDHLGWSSCRVVGVSFGGMVAQEFAVTWPDRVERLVLLCTSPGGVGGSSYPLHELAHLSPDEQAARGARVMDTRFTPEWLAAHPGDQALLGFLRSSRHAGKSEEQKRGELAQLEARRHHDVCGRIAAIRCPTFIAGGRYDGIAPVGNSEWIASHIPRATLQVYDGGHVFFLQDPSALTDVREFLNGS